MSAQPKLQWTLALLMVILSASSARAAGGGVSYATGSPIVLFVFHFDKPSGGDYSITHVSPKGGLATDTYQFTVGERSGRIVINLTKNDSSCGSFRASVTPQLLRLFVGSSGTVYFNRISDSELAADVSVIKREASNMGASGAREVLSHKFGALWLSCK